MNDTTQKIIAEAAKALRTKIWPNGQEFIDREHAEYIIQSAIEKATEKLKQQVTDLNDADKRHIEQREKIISDLRAAHAGELKLASLTMTRTPEEQAEVERFPETFTDEQGQVWEELKPAHASEKVVHCPECPVSHGEYAVCPGITAHAGEHGAYVRCSRKSKGAMKLMGFDIWVKRKT